MKKSIFWPKISVITPSFNQVKFIGKTIRSVLNQKYPNLEYIVMDGGSTDGTLEILKKYKDKLIYYSENDRGQADAVNKGLKLAGGEIVTYLNSDDLYEKNTLFIVANYFLKNKNKKWVFGKCWLINENNQKIRKFITLYKNFLLRNYRYWFLLIQEFIPQPAVFWKRELLSKIGYFNEKEYYELDYDYWLRAGKKYEPGFINDYLASFRIHRQAKSGGSYLKHYWQGVRVASGYTKNLLILSLHIISILIIVVIYKILNIFKK